MSVPTPIIVITGASSGIGKALAEALLKQGVSLIATARDPASLSSLVALGAHALPLDVTDKSACETLLQQVSDDFGHIDMLINNAGYGQMGPMLAVDEKQLRHQFDVNLFAPLRLCQLAAKQMKRQGYGCLVNIGSVSGITVTPFAGVYCASKAALHAVDEALQMELAPFNIKVVTVQPGAIASNFANAAESALPDINSEYADYSAGIAKRTAMSQQNATPAKQFADHVVRELLRPGGPPLLIRYGHGARLLPLLAYLVPRRLRHKLLKRAFGLG
ncbi:SDR family NAD(P)-dependent oxidoreductase [Corallincola holothuriorum]|uniref:SDR family NAD(P)-dependent oxidoreductase n=1 Tax=Corallincola holothuriorum TaxID=2282215 RepID=A0A368NF49_9GAMM|nr:SDR family NAD(P)-dependent oxidoreductase [Corallincola holothuriorum]RCU49202.1 SDR family NAD(P)-dependent oxidoreductase [Corallincola holothuriorum]